MCWEFRPGQMPLGLEPLVLSPLLRVHQPQQERNLTTQAKSGAVTTIPGLALRREKMTIQ